MNSNQDKIIELFHQIKNLGFVKSNRCHNTGIGKTFEDYMGIIENNIAGPDLLGYEIKSHREETSSYITLFTKSPNFPSRANTYLRDLYGIPYQDNTALKKLHTSMLASKFNTFNDTYSFKLINDPKQNVIRIGIYDVNHKKLLNDKVGYTYDCIEDILKKKLKNLFYVSAERQFKNGNECFFFNKAEIYSNPSLEHFLTMMDNGYILFDIRLGSYKSGKNIGKIHDHGSGFRVLEKNLKSLFKNKTLVD